jgi:hypothetical protein
MKKTALILFFFALLISCKKKDEFPETPDWLKDRISQMDTAYNYAGASVYLYKWNEEYYYHILNPISSCMFCEVYNYDGVKIVWTDQTFNDFINNGEKLETIWHRDFSI